MLTLDREKSKLTVQQSIPDSQNENLTVPYTVGRDFYIVSSTLDFFQILDFGDGFVQFSMDSLIYIATIFNAYVTVGDAVE